MKEKQKISKKEQIELVFYSSVLVVSLVIVALYWRSNNQRNNDRDVANVVTTTTEVTTTTITTSPKVTTTAPKVTTTPEVTAAPEVITTSPKVTTTAPKVTTTPKATKITTKVVVTTTAPQVTTAPTTTKSEGGRGTRPPGVTMPVLPDNSCTGDDCISNIPGCEDPSKPCNLGPIVGH